jgi:hypothetical protein
MSTHDTTQVTARVPICSIVFPLADFPAPLLTSRPFASWADAETAILGTVKPETYVAGRISFVLTWVDGETYQAQLPLTQQTATFTAPLASHVREALEFLAGRRPSSSMTTEQYEQALADSERFHPGRAEWAARILDGYELGMSATRGAS